jgi:hypothetical protein
MRKQDTSMVRFCPNGDGAFEDWVEQCPECGRTLQAKKPDDVPFAGEGTDLAWLVTAPNQPEAEMWANSLRDEGIQVLMQAGGPGFGAWASVAMFEHHLFVHRSDLKRARELTSHLLNASGKYRMGIPRRASMPVVNPVRRPR